MISKLKGILLPFKFEYEHDELKGKHQLLTFNKEKHYRDILFIESVGTMINEKLLNKEDFNLSAAFNEFKTEVIEILN